MNGVATALLVVSDDFTCNNKEDHSLSHPSLRELNCIGWGPMPTQITIVNIGALPFLSWNCSVQAYNFFIKRFA
jgi:hypothetical protein